MIKSLRMMGLLLVIMLTMNINSTYSQTFYLGVDLSYVNELESHDVKYINSEDKEQDPFELFADKGSNLVRLRLWHNPQWTNYCNIADVTKAMQRSKDNGMQVLLDFHYSDFWADPSRQWCPEAWSNVESDSIMGDSVYNYTYQILKALADQDLLPEMVQIGNETNGNILIKQNDEPIDGHSPGISPVNWKRQVFLLQKGIDAVKQLNADLSTEVKTVIHVAQPENALWWFRDAESNGLKDYDVMGLSYYPEWSSQDVRQLGETVKFLNETYQKEVLIVETGYPWTTDSKDNAGNVIGNGSKMKIYEQSISNDIQRDFLVELAYLVKENGGSGLIYWEPAWVSSNAKTYWGTGSHYENATLFDFENKINQGADFLSFDYSQQPLGLSDKEVVFKVNMAGQDIENGVFVTGDFTGDSWLFKTMENDGTGVFTAVENIPGRSNGAFVFYNKDEWHDAYRELVPSVCAIYWDTHREYVVSSKVMEYAYNWSSCNLVSVQDRLSESQISIYPQPVGDYLKLKTAVKITSLQLYNSMGQQIPCNLINQHTIDISRLNPGCYFILLESESGMYSKKIIKN